MKTTVVLRPLRLITVAVLGVVLMGCTTMDGYRKNHPQPDDRLDHLLALFENYGDAGEHCLEIWHPGSETLDCGRLLAELDRLLGEFPHHERTLMASAVYNYKARRLDKAQHALDQLLGHGGSHPEAAILRAKIALEEGNATMAKQVLKRQIMLVPANYELRSALASVHYAKGEFQKARNVLNVRGLANDNPWEVSYHLGLLAEGEKDWLGACRHYQDSLVQYRATVDSNVPDYVPAMARLIGLSEYISCSATDMGSYSDEDAAANTGMTAAQGYTGPATLDDIYLAEVDSNREVVFSTKGTIEGVRALQVAQPPQVIVDLPATTNALTWEYNSYDDAIVKGIALENMADRVRVRISLRAKVDAQLKNDPGNIRLALVAQ